jgi:branched-chain amino acid transport system permease protein
MILMMTLGLDIFLRAITMTIWGGSGRPMRIGISDDPLFLGPLLLNQAYVIGAGITLALFVLFVFGDGEKRRRFKGKSKVRHLFEIFH